MYDATLTPTLLRLQAIAAMVLCECVVLSDAYVLLKSELLLPSSITLDALAVT
jgi:hypothetical protein